MLSRCSGSCVFVRASCAHTSRRTANSELTLACATTGTGTGAGLAPLDARHPPSRVGSPGLAPCPVAGCRGVIGPEPSTSPDVERNSPRPSWSIHSAQGGAPRSEVYGLAWTGRSAEGESGLAGSAPPAGRGGPPEAAADQARAAREQRVQRLQQLVAPPRASRRAPARAPAPSPHAPDDDIECLQATDARLRERA